MWRKLGAVLEWLGAIYFVGFAVFGLLSLLVVVPRYQGLFAQAGQAGIFARLQEIVGPLVVLFLVISAAAWYHGKELAETKDVSLYDKIVALAILVALLVVLTPQLIEAISSLIPAIKG